MRIEIGKKRPQLFLRQRHFQPIFSDIRLPERGRRELAIKQGLLVVSATAIAGVDEGDPWQILGKVDGDRQMDRVNCLLY